MEQVYIRHLGICPISKFETSRLKPVVKKSYKFGVSACYSAPIKSYHSADQDWVYDLMVLGRTPWQMIRYKAAQWVAYALGVTALIYFGNGIAHYLVR